MQISAGEAIILGQNPIQYSYNRYAIVTKGGVLETV